MHVCVQVLADQCDLYCSARAHVLSQFAATGLDTSRVDLLPLAAANSDHLGTYAHMDISLDPFPYAGTTTTCESLYMGVPVLTLQGIPKQGHPSLHL
jgi:predicted O-linked N-acetylglucosamine transferase (SPINDLY family)